MKEFIEKLIGRLEEAGQYHLELSEANKMDVHESHRHKSFAGVYGNAISIVKELAEEYNERTMINGHYCWQNCGATEHCKECNRLCNGSIDYYENYDCLIEE